jgi:SAM-dependent methyltransferase
MAICPICGNNTIERKKRESGISMTLFKCRSCRFAWVDEDMRAEAFELYQKYAYNLVVHHNFEKMKGLYFKGFSERVARYSLRTSLSESRFLDIGCANGEFLCVAKEYGFGTVMGVEIDTAAAEHARAYGKVLSDVSLLPEELKFDVIQIKNVLGNIHDVSGFMKAAVSRLQKGGRLWLDVLNDNSITSWRRKICRSPDGRYGTLRPPFVVSAFEKCTVNALLKSLGLRVLSIHSSYMSHPLVPYFSSLGWQVLGRATLLCDAGSMLISDSILD